MIKISFSRQKLLSLAKECSQETGTTLFLSCGSHSAAKKSFLFLFPFQELIVTRGRCIHRVGDHIAEEAFSFQKLQHTLIDSGGNWSFFLGYELGFLIEPKLHSLYTPASHVDAHFFRAACYVELDYELDRAYAHIDQAALKYIPKDQRRVLDQLVDNSYIACDLAAATPLLRPQIYFRQSKEFFLKKVEKIKELIRDGEIYQLTLSQEIVIQQKRDPFDLFVALTSANPTAFSAYIKMQDEAIVSCSPERLVKKEGTFVETRPIKGTRPRGKTPEEDSVMLQELLSSSKERSELVMICDLMRNDLSKICDVGTVYVPEVLRTEAYCDLYHRLSIVEGRVAKEMHPIEVIEALFPGGSVTGCPKIRAMELIYQLEERRRGVYTGSIGYFLENGDMDCNILIRTLHAIGSNYSLQVGSGIVIDSDPLKEWEETLHKASSILKVFGV